MSLSRILGLIAASLLVAVAGAENKPDKIDPAKLLGKYVDIEGVKSGEKADADRLKGQFVNITKDTFKIEGEKSEQTFEFSYKLKPDTSPVEIDLEIVYPDDLKGNKAIGIISLDGDKLKLCYNTEIKDRPKTFESTKENGYFLWTMKKSEKK